MLYTIAKYGGFLVILLSWICLVLPFLILRRKRRITVISQLMDKTPVGLLIKYSVIMCGIAQILFARYLYLNFDLFSARVGIILFGLGSISFIFCGIIDYYKSKIAHQLFVNVYYVLIVIGFVLLSFSLPIVSKVFAYSLMFIPLYLYLIKNDETNFEIVTVIISTGFALSIYFYLGILNFV